MNRQKKRSGAWTKTGLLKTGILFFALLLGSLAFTGCAKRESPGIRGEQGGDDRLFVVTTIFPYYDFVRQIGGDRVRLNLVVPAGMDSHSFEPTPADMITIQKADLMIRNGGAMEQWVDQVAASLDTSRLRRLTMMDYVDVVEEEVVEGMEEEEHGHEHSREEEEAGEFDAHDGQELDIEYDEHIWTSPVNSMKIVEIISDTLAEMDPANEAYYRENAASYLEELSTLDEQFREIVSNGRHRMMVLADKFPLRYFADTYGLSYRAAFSGCSTDTEPSARTIAYLIDRVRENDLKAVYYLELSSHRTADIISEETGTEPLLFHSCHNVSRREFDEGVTYLQLMRQNAEHLKKGLE